jgi:hypothetical protein
MMIHGFLDLAYTDRYPCFAWHGNELLKQRWRHLINKNATHLCMYYICIVMHIIIYNIILYYSILYYIIIYNHIYIYT